MANSIQRTMDHSEGGQLIAVFFLPFYYPDLRETRFSCTETHRRVCEGQLLSLPCGGDGGALLS